MYRIVNTQIWSDSWFFELSPEQKLLFLYLCSSSYTSHVGIYKATIKHIELETGIKNVEEILKSLYPKVIYVKELKLIVIRNFLKYQNYSGGKFDKAVYQKFLEESPQVQIILLKEIEYLRDIIQKYDKELYEDRVSQMENKEYIPYTYPMDTPSIPYQYPIDTLSIGYPIINNNKKINNNISESETESEYISETESESGNLKGNLKTTIVGQNDQSQKAKDNRKVNSKGDTKKKYPSEVKVFYEKFKAFREEYLRVPITYRDWHIRAYSVINKLLKKYSLAELEQALEDLQTPVWEDKAPKILELWHFEDWLTKWKVWKNGNIVPKRKKTEDELIEEEVERVLRWAYPNLEDYEFEGNKRVLLAYRKEHGTYPFDVPDEILKGGEKNGISR